MAIMRAYWRAIPRLLSAILMASLTRLTEMDAMIAYLQILGRMVDFTAVRAEDLRQ